MKKLPTVVTMLAVVLLSGFSVGRYLLGRNFFPVVNAARVSAKEQLESMVDASQLALERAKAEAAEVRQRTARLQRSRFEAEAQVQRADKEIEAVKLEIKAAKERLGNLKVKVDKNEVVRLISGRDATPAELLSIVGGIRNQIEIAQEKAKLLEDFQATRRENAAKIVRLAAEAPVALERLELSVDLLERKVAMAKELKQLSASGPTSDKSLDNFLAAAQKSLEQAHTQLDATLKEQEALLASHPWELIPQEGKTQVAGVEEVRQALRQALESAPVQ